MQLRVYDRTIRKRAALLLAVAVVAAACFAGACPFVSQADEVSDLKQSIAQKQKEIEETQSQRKQLEGGLTDVKQIISSLETSKSNLAAYVKQLDTELTAAQTRITELTDMISEKESEIVQTKAELEEALEREASQYDAMKLRIQNMYERGTDFYFEAIFSAASFGDMLNRADYVEKITESDRKILDNFRTTREYVEVCKAQLEEEQELLEKAKVKVEQEQESLETLISEKQTEINAFQADINDKEAVLREYEAEIAARNAEIKALEDAVKAEQAALEAASNPKRKYDGGMFAWPAPSYTRISDDYGDRMHPTLGIKRFHNGVDMAAPGGSPILAAYNGTVVAAAYNASMGNYIMIDHGDNLFTIYMHASALYVSKGAEVVKGQKIAAVGTTGRSTGNHLHFSVRLNGNYVNPWGYLK
ncbi:peptidoglycan DD-metalloendopeptidase family protein [Lachnospiraceae bacterium MD335]|nr:peptidoglycan DD-metalloendopeptidase family protein [Lachnospiraceae bacterium MD335]